MVGECDHCVKFYNHLEPFLYSSNMFLCFLADKSISTLPSSSCTAMVKFQLEMQRFMVDKQ